MKRLISLLISLVLLVVLFSLVDIKKLSEDLRGIRMDYFAAGLFMFIPQIAVISWRWKRLCNVFTPLEYGKAVSMVLASGTLNLIFPSKLGDLAKGYFLASSPDGNSAAPVPFQTAAGIVIFEKMLDVGSLSAIMLLGAAFTLIAQPDTPLPLSLLAVPLLLGFAFVALVLLLYFISTRFIPGYGKLESFLKSKPKLEKFGNLLTRGHSAVEQLQARGGKRGEILAVSLFIWVLHLIQIAFFFYALGVTPPLAILASLVAFAIFIGLLPLTIAGFGTRDAALVMLFASYPSHTILAVSMLINLRYIIPAAAGIPFFHRYLNAMLHGKNGTPTDSGNQSERITQ